MKIIYKYQLQNASIFTLMLPKNAEILCVKIDQKTFTPCIWCKIDKKTMHILEARTFENIFTGIDIHEPQERKELIYIGTYQSMQELVYHLFEKKFLI